MALPNFRRKFQCPTRRAAGGHQLTLLYNVNQRKEDFNQSSRRAAQAWRPSLGSRQRHAYAARREDWLKYRRYLTGVKSKILTKGGVAFRSGASPPTARPRSSAFGTQLPSNSEPRWIWTTDLYIISILLYHWAIGSIRYITSFKHSVFRGGCRSVAKIEDLNEASKILSLTPAG